MAHGRTTLTPAEEARMVESMRRLSAHMKKTRASLLQVLWIAIGWVSVFFILTCGLLYFLVWILIQYYSIGG